MRRGLATGIVMLGLVLALVVFVVAFGQLFVDQVAQLLRGLPDLVDRIVAQLPDVAWFQKRLATFGYATPQTGELDAQTKSVITSFQMKYRPAIIDGTPDAETAALLDVLTTPVAKAP